jgi:hypothetical protein
MKNNNTKYELNDMFISSILLYCGYKMDKNINYKTFLNNSIVSKYLKDNIDKNIIKYINNNIDFTYKVIYLRNNLDAECMICYNNTNCYLVFIGTQMSLDDKMSLCKDLWTDICLGLESIDFLDSKIKIHSKYIDNMKCENLLGKIKKIINKLGFNKINICGHSMGCGLGLYTALELTHKFKDIQFNLITLDSPKIGNYKLNKYIKKIKNLSQIDLINNKDIVPLFPFIYPKYLHISSKTYITNCDGNIEICEKPNELNIFTNYSVKDHYTHNIIINIYNGLTK